MAEGIPVLWSDDIKVDTLPPLAILRAQANALRQMTKGLLEAEITSSNLEKGRVEHRFDLIAPGLDGYRHRLFLVSHSRQMVYPVKVVALHTEKKSPKPWSPRSPLLPAVSLPTPEMREALARMTGAPKPEEVDLWTPNAATEQEFVELVRQILQSNEVRSLIQSLVARSNEQRYKPSADPPTDEADESSSNDQTPPSNPM